MPLARHLYREDVQELTGHVDPDPLLLGGQQMWEPSQMPNWKAKRVSQVPMHNGSRKASPSRKFAFRRKRIFSKSSSDVSLDSAGLNGCEFVKGHIFLGDEVGISGILGHRGIRRHPIVRK
jgi:hypothetical protein